MNDSRLPKQVLECLKRRQDDSYSDVAKLNDYILQLRGEVLELKQENAIIPALRTENTDLQKLVVELRRTISSLEDETADIGARLEKKETAVRDLKAVLAQYVMEANRQEEAKLPVENPLEMKRGLNVKWQPTSPHVAAKSGTSYAPDPGTVSGSCSSSGRGRGVERPSNPASRESSAATGLMQPSAPLAGSRQSLGKHAASTGNIVDPDIIVIDSDDEEEAEYEEERHPNVPSDEAKSEYASALDGRYWNRPSAGRPRSSVRLLRKRQDELADDGTKAKRLRPAGEKTGHVSGKSRPWPVNDPPCTQCASKSAICYQQLDSGRGRCYACSISKKKCDYTKD